MNQRQLNALQTRESIFKVALELFIQNGFENVSITDITKKAGTAKGTFYTHFKSKDQVIVEHFKGIDLYYEEVLEKLTDEGSNYEKIITILREGFLYTENIGKELLKVVLINQISGNEEIPYVMDKSRRIYRIVLKLIVDGQKSGEFVPDRDPDELVMAILQHYSGIYMRWCLLEENETLSELGIKSLKMLIDSFKV